MIKSRFQDIKVLYRNLTNSYEVLTDISKRTYKIGVRKWNEMCLRECEKELK